MALDSSHQGSRACSRFQPSEIVCLELAATCLYAEVVQIVEARRLCWARPLVLVRGSSETAESFQSSKPRSLHSPNWHDLRQGADLLLPAILFRQALDVEAIPVLLSLYGLDAIANSTPQAITARRQLNDFISQICQFYPDAFSSN